MKKQQKFEEVMAQLEAIVQKLGDEGTSLEDALALYADAADKIKLCSDQLNHAEIRIAEIQKELEMGGADHDGI